MSNTTAHNLEAKPLSQNEELLLRQSERVIQDALSKFWDFGSALRTIRDNELYRIDYWTIEEYALEEWDISRPRLYQYIAASEVMDALSTIVDKDGTPQFQILPKNEAQARPLTSIKPEFQPEAWGTVLTEKERQGCTITAAFVQQVTDEYRENKVRKNMRLIEDKDKKRGLSDEVAKYFDGLFTSIKETRKSMSAAQVDELIVQLQNLIEMLKK